MPPDDDEFRVDDYEPSESEADLLSTGTGLYFRAQASRDEEFTLSSEAQPFAKWLRVNRPDLPVHLDSGSTLALHSGDLWMPLAFLGSEVAVHLYIDLVAHYIYDKVRGALHHDSPKAEVSFVFQNKSGTITRVYYKGPAKEFKECFQKVDIIRLLEDD